METRNVKRKTNDRCAPLPKKWGRWICRCVCCQFFFWAVEDQRCGEALELGGHGHRNPPRGHADTRSDLDHDSGIPLQISTEIRTMYPNHVKRWGPHPERCPRLSRQAGQQGILTEPHMNKMSHLTDTKQQSQQQKCLQISSWTRRCLRAFVWTWAWALLFSIVAGFESVGDFTSDQAAWIKFGVAKLNIVGTCWSVFCEVK